MGVVYVKSARFNRKKNQSNETTDNTALLGDRLTIIAKNAVTKITNSRASRP